MEVTLIGFYVTLIIIALLFAYGGYENTMRLFVYIDLQLKYAIVKIKMFAMKKRLEKQLNLPNLNHSKLGKLENDK